MKLPYKTLPRYLCAIYHVPTDHQFGPICVGINETPDASRGEDCLFVNVYKPSKATSRSKLPVWVYIPGGGYSNNANNNYNGSEVVAKSGENIVFVNFNYRVGALGFLASSHVAQDGDLNAGLLDQRKLLHWVKKYIREVNTLQREGCTNSIVRG